MKKIILISLLLINVAYADKEVNNYYYNSEAIKTENVFNNIDFKSAMATSNAMSGHQIDYGIYGWQGSFSIGGYEDTIKPSFALGKRYNGVLYNTTVGEKSFSATANWTF